MPKRLIKYGQTQPARAILAVIAVVTFTAGIWLFTPWHVPSISGPIASQAFNWPTLVGGAVNSIASLPALLAIKTNEPRALARGALWLFAWYLFVTLARILVVGSSQLAFVPTLIIALVLSVIYIEQKFVSKERQVDKEVEVE